MRIFFALLLACSCHAAIISSTATTETTCTDIDGNSITTYTGRCDINDPRYGSVYAEATASSIVAGVSAMPEMPPPYEIDLARASASLKVEEQWLFAGSGLATLKLYGPVDRFSQYGSGFELTVNGQSIHAGGIGGVYTFEGSFAIPLGQAFDVLIEAHESGNRFSIYEPFVTGSHWSIYIDSVTPIGSDVTTPEPTTIGIVGAALLLLTILPKSGSGSCIFRR